MAIYQWNIDEDHLTLSLIGRSRRGDLVLRSEDLARDIDLDKLTETELERFVSSFEKVTMRRASHASEHAVLHS